MTLEEYATKNPYREPEREPAENTQRGEDREAEPEPVRRAEELKRSIEEQIRAGNAPGNILLSAVQAIGLLSGDPKWAEEQTAALDAFYNAAVDTAVNTAKDAKDQAARYAERVRGDLRRNLTRLQKVQAALTNALEMADALTAPEIPGF